MDERAAFRLKREPRLESKHAAFPYQTEAASFVASRTFSAIFHEQGLGKTKIAIDVMLQWLASKAVDVVLVITKKSLVANWAREFAAHSYLRPMILGEDGRRNLQALTGAGRLVLGHYEVVLKEEQRLRAWLGMRRVGVILDESAKIKNPDAALSRALHRIAPLFEKRVIMTGTPVANRPFDVWSQIYFLDQGASLGTDFVAFKADHDFHKKYVDDQPAFDRYQQRLASVADRLKTISVRERKDGGRIALPNKEFVRVPVSWEPEQYEMYRQVREDLRLVVQKEGELVREDQEPVLKRLLRLVQIASNPRLVDEAYTGTPGKLSVLQDLVRDIVRGEEKVIIWTSFTDNAEWLASQFADLGANALHGQLSMERRNSVIAWFIENRDDRVLVATPGAAKEGLTLTVANHAIFFDRTYSLDDYLQAQDRIHRVSQTKTCFVYNLVMQDSVDEWIETLIDEKRLAAQLTQGDIDVRAYAERATLSFFEVLKAILH